MNKSKEAEDQKLIARFVEFVQTAFQIASHELGDSSYDKVVRHDGYTFSVPFLGRKIYFKCSVDKLP